MSKNSQFPESVIFVADLFVEDYAGGAEMTSEALISASPYAIKKVHSQDVTRSMIAANTNKIWVFGNFVNLNPQLIPHLMGTCKYVIIEYDYKFCAHRSIEKHHFVEGTPCDCEKRVIGEAISSFYYNSQCIFWMSEKQRENYLQRFPHLEEKNSIVLSSVFDDAFFVRIDQLRQTHPFETKQGWIVFKSNSWIKGTEAAVDYCEKNKLQYKIVSNLTPDETLEELAKAKGFVYLPPGGDTCPRMVIEAKLLGCDIIANEHVEHATEDWFQDASIDDIEEYLFANRAMFWNFVKNEIVEKKLTLSGYVTTRNCVSQGYPFEECIRSLLAFCDEVCVVDGGSTDGTQERLLGLQKQHMKDGTSLISTDSFDFIDGSRLKVKVVERDWSSPRFALFDGMQKAEARRLCAGDFCIQLDADEIVHQNDYLKYRQLVENFPRGVNVVSLPVVEYWGGEDKIRMDVTPWKWRLSRNIPSITHGIPAHLRRSDENGMYAAPGTDGCDLIHSRTGEPVPHIGFYDGEAHALRVRALGGDEAAREAYEAWFKRVVEALPSVHHFSWYAISRKIRTYRDYWSAHWQSIEAKSTDDRAESNMFFDVPWSEVTESMIEEKAKQLAQETGGWVFHEKWRGQRVPCMSRIVAPPESGVAFYADRAK